MLPSPIWPNGTGRQPGIICLTLSVARIEKRRHLRHGHRNVVLDRPAFKPLHFRHHLAQPPQFAPPADRWRQWLHRSTRPSSKATARMSVAALLHRRGFMKPASSNSTYQLPVALAAGRGSRHGQSTCRGRARHDLEGHDRAAAHAPDQRQQRQRSPRVSHGGEHRGLGLMASAAASLTLR